jgi:hypothetical protein
VPRDALGNPVSAADEAVALIDEAVDRILRHDGGVVDAARRATQADPTSGLARAVLALADPTEAEEQLPRARRLVRASGTEYERSLVAFLDVLLSQGMWAAAEVGRRHVRDHPRDLLGVGLVGTMVERSARHDVHEAVLAVYEPSRRVLGDHPYLLCMVGFVVQEQGRFVEAGQMAQQALDAQPSSVTAAHLRAHVHVETADHKAGLEWLDGFRSRMDPTGDYVHHMGWHAALHSLAMGDADDVLARLEALSGPDCDTFRHVVDNGTLLMRCRLCGIVDVDDDPTHGRAGTPPPEWLTEIPSLYVGFHTAVGLAVQRRPDDLRSLASASAGMTAPGAGELLAPLSRALADYCDDRLGPAAEALEALRPTMYRWGGSRAQREVVEDVLIDAAVRGDRPEIAARVLTERIERRPSRWDEAAAATLRSAQGGTGYAVVQ